MANNAKTPVMVLQELTVKRNVQSPEYSIIHAREGTHDNEFHYQVIAVGVSAIGIGRSKQVAKHDAARKALDLLAKSGIYQPGETPVKAPRSEFADSPVKVGINSIGTLSDLCVENKIPFPTFEEISNVGPPHCKEFTYQCQIASLVTRATAGTKKQAKQLAAKEMLERMIHVLPELVAQCNEAVPSQQAIMEKDAEAIDQYKQRKTFIRPKPNLAMKIENYPQHIKKILEEKNVSVNDMQKYFNEERTEDTLASMLSALELNYMIEEIQDYPLIVSLTINTEVPFTTFAIGENYSTASNQAVQNTFQILEVLIK